MVKLELRIIFVLSNHENLCTYSLKYDFRPPVILLAGTGRRKGHPGLCPQERRVYQDTAKNQMV